MLERLPHARPKAQRNLMHFLQAAFDSGALERRPIQWRVRRNGVQFSFAGLAPALSIYFANHGEIDVAVHWRDRCWDLLYCDGAIIAPAAGGVIDLLTLPEYRQIYRTKAQLLQAETFEPFLSWCRDCLMCSRYVCFSCTQGGTFAWLTSSSLANAEEDECGRLALWPTT